MRSIADLEASLHNRYLSTLNIYRFIQSQPFRQAYNDSTDEQRATANRLIDNLDRFGLEIWTKRRLCEYNMIHLLDVKFLRQIAKERGIYGYGSMDRTELIKRIERSKENAEVAR